jgi:hypothetical protein
MVFQKGNNFWKNREKTWNKGLTKENDKILSRLSKKMKIKMKGNHNKQKIFNENEEKEIKELYKEGISMKEIAIKFGCGEYMIYRVVQKDREDKNEEDVKMFVKNLKNLSNYEIGYIVGILDGEGSLGINKGENKGYYGYSPKINFSNQERDIINFIHSKLGMTTGLKKGKDCFSVNLYGKEIISEFLKFIIPYTHSRKTKKKAEILLKFCSAENSKEREHYYQELRLVKSKLLNANG